MGAALIELAWADMNVGGIRRAEVGRVVEGAGRVFDVAELVHAPLLLSCV